MTEPARRRSSSTSAKASKPRSPRIDFTGNHHFSSRRLKQQMKEVKEHNIVTWIRKKNLYIPSKLDEDLEHIKNYYQDYGYTNVTFGEPQIVDDRQDREEAARQDHHPDQGRDDPSLRRRHRHRQHRLHSRSRSSATCRSRRARSSAASRSRTRARRVR